MSKCGCFWDTGQGCFNSLWNGFDMQKGVTLEMLNDESPEKPPHERVVQGAFLLHGEGAAAADRAQTPSLGLKFSQGCRGCWTTQTAVILGLPCWSGQRVQLCRTHRSFV